MKVIDYQDYLNYLSYLSKKSLSEKQFHIICDDGIEYNRYTTLEEVYEYYILGHLYYDHSQYYINFQEPSRTKKEIEIFKVQIQRMKKLKRILE
ncbi:hypothetical protein M0Q97_12985 [Candidatus Dojkabacteria bacterium]|jgi:hypothetical protein|nr:hypothetical protein [Candidatus Dojkabacteria bacterium]